MIVEVKRQDKLTSRMVIAKATAIRKWIHEEKNGYEYEFWTDELIKAVKLMLESKNVSK